MATMERIVVGGDHTPSATSALRWAVQEAAVTGAAVVVVHAFDRSDRADLLLEKDLARARRDARYRTQSWVVEVLSDLHVEVPVIVSTPDGTVEDALADAARHARMVVVGAAEGRRYRDLATALAARCACPVITVTGDRVALPG